MTEFEKNQKGAILVLALSATGIFLILTMGAISYGLLQQKLNKQKIAQTQALHVAEAGVNYYRWVLYHDNNEYCNKETCKSGPNYGPYGPYDYTDSSGNNIIGHYQLYIIPPALNGSTIVTIKSVGWVDNYPNIKRTVEVKCGIPSWSTYSTLSGSDIRFGAGTEVWGPIHSNGGIRFDGLAHNLITSSLLKYDDPDHTGGQEFGVHTHVNAPPGSGTNDDFRPLEAPPNTVPSRNDIFWAGRNIGVPTISFDLLNNYATSTLTMATQHGLVLPTLTGNNKGYHITLNTNKTLTIKKVTSVSDTCQSNPTDGIDSETNFMTTTTPANGIVFVKDKVWVDGKVDGNRITILAFKEPLGGNTTDIVINNNLTYTHYDGTDSIGLIAQRDINVGLYSADDLQIDAAMVAKEGRIGRYYFSSGCSSTYYIRNRITINGSLATKNRYGFAYADGTGYQIRRLNYDNNLTFIPPPHFPTTGEYTFISWEEK